MTPTFPSESLEIQNLMGVIKINIPGQKNPKQLFLLGSWLFYWLLVFALILTIGYQITIGAYQAREFGFYSLFMGILIMLSILVWGMRGVFAVYAFFWQIAGLETLEISHNILKIRRSIFGIGRTREFEKV